MEKTATPPCEILTICGLLKVRNNHYEKEKHVIEKCFGTYFRYDKSAKDLFEIGEVMHKGKGEEGSPGVVVCL